MLKRVALSALVVLAWACAGTPVQALNWPAQQHNDLYAITSDGKIYRVPVGRGPQLELDIATIEADQSYNGEWLGFDAGSCEFLVGPGVLGSNDYYKRLPLLLNPAYGVTGDLAGSLVIGGQGASTDYATPAAQPSGRSDLLVANPVDPAVGPSNVQWIRGNGTIQTAFTIPSQWFFPKDIAVDHIGTGNIYVSVQGNETNGGAILSYSPAGVHNGTFQLPPTGSPAVIPNPCCMVYDQHDVIPGYELVVAACATNTQIWYIDVNNSRVAGDPQYKLLTDAPLAATECEDILFSPQGKLIYLSHGAAEDGSDAAIFQIEPVNNSLFGTVAGTALHLASIARAKGLTYVSRNCLSHLDNQLMFGVFSRTTGPNGRPATAVKVYDNEFSSGINYIEATGSNLAINGKALPVRFTFDPRHEITTFSFVAEKINATAGASIKVVGVDWAGLVGDPPVEMSVIEKSGPSTTEIDLSLLDASNTRTMKIINEGIKRFTVEIAGKTFRLDSDPKAPEGAVLEKPEKNNRFTIREFGTTTILLPNAKIMKLTTHGTGNTRGAEAFIEIN